MSKGIRCELISWETFYSLARQLALLVREAEFQPDVIVAIARGGYMPARILSDCLDIFNLADMKIEHYQGTHKQPEAIVRYPLTADIAAKRVLLVDDVSDSGDSFQAAIAHLQARGEPEALRTAVLHHKTVSSYKPDFFAAEVHEWRWIIYPWAVMEDLRTFLKEMDVPPASVSEFDDYLRVDHGIRVERDILAEVLNTATVLVE